MKNKTITKILLAALIGTNGAAAATLTWTNPDTTTPPGSTQEWNYNSGANWNSAPADGDIINLRRWTGSEFVAAVASLETVSNVNQAYTSGFGSQLYIGSTGNLRMDGTNNDGRVTIGALGGTGDYVSIAAGGQISWVDPTNTGQAIGNGYVILSNNATLDTAGTIIAPLQIEIRSGSTINMTDGLVEARQTFNSILVDGALNQSGGTIQNTPVLTLTNGSYAISGGSTSADLLLLSDATSGAGATLHVDGSGASGITFSGGLRYAAATDRENATWKFTLDNGTNHITPVTLTTNGNHGATLRTDTTLDVGLNGGVLLSGTNKFALVNRASGTDTAWGTGPGALWDDTSTSAEISVTLAGAANKGSLNAATPGASVTFAAASVGYIDLTGLLGSETSLQLNLLWSGQSTANIADFTTLLGNAGLNYWLISANEIGLELDPSVSGSTYFAWDLVGIGSDGMLEGISVIPEPSSYALLGGCVALLMVFRRRR